jgi:hypothetical protein
MANIPLSQLQAMFTGMRDEAGWDTDGDLLWGYFFVAPEPERLAPLRQRLEALGYEYVGEHPTDEGQIILHIQKIETHSPESLLRRNNELNRLAHDLGIVYDGMDAGPVRAGVRLKPWWKFWR